MTVFMTRYPQAETCCISLQSAGMVQGKACQATAMIQVSKPLGRYDTWSKAIKILRHMKQHTMQVCMLPRLNMIVHMYGMQRVHQVIITTMLIKMSHVAMSVLDCIVPWHHVYGCPT